MIKTQAIFIISVLIALTGCEQPKKGQIASGETTSKIEEDESNRKSVVCEAEKEYQGRGKSWVGLSIDAEAEKVSYIIFGDTSNVYRNKSLWRKDASSSFTLKEISISENFDYVSPEKVWDYWKWKFEVDRESLKAGEEYWVLDSRGRYHSQLNGRWYYCRLLKTPWTDWVNSTNDEMRKTWEQERSEKEKEEQERLLREEEQKKKNKI